MSPTRMLQKTDRFSIAASSLFAALLLAGPNVASAQDAANDCQTQLRQAEEAYFNGEFERTLSLLTPCIGSEAYEGEDAALAYTLAARSYIVQGDEDLARGLISALLTRQPGYEPDARFPPPFRRLIADVRSEMLAAGQLRVPTPVPNLTEATPDSTQIEPIRAPDLPSSSSSSRRRLMLLGGGAAVALAGVTTAIVLSGSGGSEPPPGTSGFPRPVGRPSGQ